MDANGQRFWLLADPEHWMWRSHVRWDPGCRSLLLASERTLTDPGDPGGLAAAAGTALERVPRAVDEVEAVARWDEGAGAVVVRSHLPGEAVLLELPESPTDLAVGFDGVLYLAVGGAVRMHDLRGRWADVTVASADLAAWRLAADPAGGVWILDRGRARAGRLTGRPLPLGPPVEWAGTTFRPDPENCDPPGIRVLPEPAWDEGERPVALALDPGRGPAVLSWVGTRGESRLRYLAGGGARGGEGDPPPVHRLVGVRYGYALAFLGDGSCAVRMPGRPDAPAFEIAAAGPDGALHPSGDVYPLADDALEGPFCHRVAGPPRYPVALGEGRTGAEPLHKLSLRNRARRGEARHWTGGAARLLDSGDPRTVWHRLHAEARLPEGTGFVAWCAVTDAPSPPDPADRSRWVPHAFGEVRVAEPQAARAAWEDAPSELPHHPGLGGWPRERGRAGLWSVLLQDPRRQVRRLVGRYLWIRVELHGDGRVGPEIAALRAWESRFSYRDQYLPRLYRERRFGASAREPGERLALLPAEEGEGLDVGGLPAEPLRRRLEEAGVRVAPGARVRVDAPGASWLLHDGSGGRGVRLHRGPREGEIGVYRPRATPADFLERMLASFEGVLTPLEDRIAAAHLLTDPDAAPEEQLEWLAAWTGVAFDAALPAGRRRAWLRAAPELARYHGTRRGLELALDVASGGGVAGGEIVVLEDFRLRRLLATLLGVELVEEDDPLLPGLRVSGNSVVGDTAVLGESERDELLALFRDEVATEEEREAIRAFYERLAFRATVLVHQAVEPVELGLLRRVVELESPAHADVRVVTATWPLLVGVASLVGVDTYLGPRRPRLPARVARSRASEHYVTAPATLDPRLAGGAAPPPAPSAPPVADAGDDFDAPFGASFELDGSRSRASEGRRIERYRWRRLPPDAP